MKLPFLAFLGLFLLFSTSPLGTQLLPPSTILSIEKLVLQKSESSTYNRYASVGSWVTDSETGRTRYTSNSIYNLLPTKSLVDLNRRNTVFVNCGEKRSSSGFVIDVKSYINDRSDGTYKHEEKSKLVSVCEGEIVVTAAHVAESHIKEGCGVYHQDEGTGFSSVNKHSMVKVSSIYYNKNDSINSDYAFLKLDKKYLGDGLELCNSEEVNKYICSIDNAVTRSNMSLMLSQSYGGGLDELMLSDSCCVDSSRVSTKLNIAHKCHSSGGASGGALISVDRAKGSSCVIGVHSGSDPHTIHNYAAPTYNESFRKELDRFIKTQCSI